MLLSHCDLWARFGTEFHRRDDSCEEHRTNCISDYSCTPKTACHDNGNVRCSVTDGDFQWTCEQKPYYEPIITFASNYIKVCRVQSISWQYAHHADCRRNPALTRAPDSPPECMRPSPHCQIIRAQIWLYAIGACRKELAHFRACTDDL